MQLEAFLGADPTTQMLPWQAMAIGKAKQYTPKEFTFDRSKGLADVHVDEYAKLAAADKASGSYDRSMEKLLSFVKATKNALKDMLKADMTDADTQKVVDIIGRMNLVLEITQQTFAGGIPAGTASEVDSYLKEINDLVQQLMNKRQTMSKQSYQSAVAAVSIFNKLQTQPVKTSYISELAIASGITPPAPDAGSTVPGGGSASSPESPGTYIDTVPGGGVVSAPSGIPVEQSTAQKYGPLAALVAGGILAFYALR